MYSFWSCSCIRLSLYKSIVEPEDSLPELYVKDIPVINEIDINLDIVKKRLDALLINKSSGPDRLST